MQFDIKVSIFNKFLLTNDSEEPESTIPVKWYVSLSLILSGMVIKISELDVFSPLFVRLLMQ